jgi:hypothetical protein
MKIKDFINLCIDKEFLKIGIFSLDELMIEEYNGKEIWYGYANHLPKEYEDRTIVSFDIPESDGKIVLNIDYE